MQMSNSVNLETTSSHLGFAERGLPGHNDRFPRSGEQSRNPNDSALNDVVLVVNDARDQLDLLTFVLRKSGYHV